VLPVYSGGGLNLELKPGAGDDGVVDEVGGRVVVVVKLPAVGPLTEGGDELGPLGTVQVHAGGLGGGERVEGEDGEHSAVHVREGERVGVGVAADDGGHLSLEVLRDDEGLVVGEDAVPVNVASSHNNLLGLRFGLFPCRWFKYTHCHRHCATPGATFFGRLFLRGRRNRLS